MGWHSGFWWVVFFSDTLFQLKRVNWWYINLTEANSKNKFMQRTNQSNQVIQYLYHLNNWGLRNCKETGIMHELKECVTTADWLTIKACEACFRYLRSDCRSEYQFSLLHPSYIKRKNTYKINPIWNWNAAFGTFI